MTTGSIYDIGYRATTDRGSVGATPSSPLVTRLAAQRLGLGRGAGQGPCR